MKPYLLRWTREMITFLRRFVSVSVMFLRQDAQSVIQNVISLDGCMHARPIIWLSIYWRLSTNKFIPCAWTHHHLQRFSRNSIIMLACHPIYKVLLHEPEHARSQLANDVSILVFASSQPLIPKKITWLAGALAPVACLESGRNL